MNRPARHNRNDFWQLISRKQIKNGKSGKKIWGVHTFLNCNLSKFYSNRQIFRQFFNFMILVYQISQKLKMLSAYIYILQYFKNVGMSFIFWQIIYIFIYFGRSFIYRAKSTPGKTTPWGIPLWTSTETDFFCYYFLFFV